MQQFRSLKEHVYEYLIDTIESGGLTAGDKINEQRVCEALGVSRTPVREALIELAGSGCLEYIPRKGFRLKGFDEENAREVFEIFGPLDARAAFLALPHLTEKDLIHLGFLCESMELAIEKNLFKKYDELQNEFHEVYIQKCANKRLSEYITELKRLFMRREYSSVDKATEYTLLKKANAEHARIVELFKQKNSEKLQNYIRDVHWSLDNASYVVW